MQSSPVSATFGPDGDQLVTIGAEPMGKKKSNRKRGRSAAFTSKVASTRRQRSAPHDGLVYNWS